MPDYMMTVTGGMGARDVLVENAEDIREAIKIAEHETGCRVSHGRGGVGELFDPAVVIDAATGAVEVKHDRSAKTSMTIANPFKGKVTFPKG